MKNIEIIRIEAITAKELGVEIYLSQPSQFVAQHLFQILPEWSSTEAWVALILQQSQIPLNQLISQVKTEKDRLRNQFMNFSQSVVKNLSDHGFLSDFFDPITGYPVLSRAGEITHDDVAVARALLGCTVTSEHCCALIHPRWKTAVYPGVLMAEASPVLMQPILTQIAQQYHWTIHNSST